MVLRDSKIILQSPSQQHSFNFPYQLASIENASDSVSEAQVTEPARTTQETLPSLSCFKEVDAIKDCCHTCLTYIDSSETEPLLAPSGCSASKLW